MEFDVFVLSFIFFVPALLFFTHIKLVECGGLCACDRMHQMEKTEIDYEMINVEIKSGIAVSTRTT